jgi:hypothetical protein
MRRALALVMVVAAGVLWGRGGAVNVTSIWRVADGEGGLPAGTLATYDDFGTGISSWVDLNGDGAALEVLVGALNAESVFVLGCDSGLRVESVLKIANGYGGLPLNTLQAGDEFGSALSGFTDVDGDGAAREVLVGAQGDNADAEDSGAVYLLYLDSTGRVSSFLRYANGDQFPNTTFSALAGFGHALSSFTDLNGDGAALEVAVGANSDGAGGNEAGAVYVLFLSSGTGALASWVRITGGSGGLPAGVVVAYELFGSALSTFTDLDGDGAARELVATAEADGAGAAGAGAAYVLFLSPLGQVAKYQKVCNGQGGLPAGLLGSGAFWGVGASAFADLNGDGVANSVLVSAQGEDSAGENRTATYVLSLNGTGFVQQWTLLADGEGGIPAGTLRTTSRFGSAYARSWAGSGNDTIVVGAYGDTAASGVPVGGGAVYVMQLVCPAGSWWVGSGVCSPCGAGTYGESVNARSCTRCPAGTSSSDVGAVSNATCAPCRAGTYASQPGSSSCTECAAGTYSATTRATSALVCTRCGAGTFSPQRGATNSSTCQECPAGTSSSALGAASSDTCVTCSPGEFQPSAGSSSCLLCDAGYFSTSVGATSNTTCLACPSGTYSSSPGAPSNASCEDCPTGSYNPRAAQTACQACPAGTASAAYGATASSTCQACPSHSYAADDGSSECKPCGKGLVGTPADQPTSCSAQRPPFEWWYVGLPLILVAALGGGLFAFYRFRRGGSGWTSGSGSGQALVVADWRMSPLSSPRVARGGGDAPVDATDDAVELR